MERAVALVEQLERDRRPATGQPDAAPSPATAGDLRPRRSGSTDDDVTVHCDERRLDREHALRPVDVGAVDLDVDRRPGRRSGASAPTATSTPSSRTGRVVLVLEHDLGPRVGEAHVDVVVELADDLGLDVGGDVAPRRRR